MFDLRWMHKSWLDALGRAHEGPAPGLESTEESEEPVLYSPSLSKHAGIFNATHDRRHHFLLLFAVSHKELRDLL